VIGLHGDITSTDEDPPINHTHFEYSIGGMLSLKMLFQEKKSNVIVFLSGLVQYIQRYCLSSGLFVASLHIKKNQGEKYITSTNFHQSVSVLVIVSSGVLSTESRLYMYQLFWSYQTNHVLSP